MSEQKIVDLNEEYIEAAHELHVKQCALLNYASELHAFIEIRDALKNHPEFSGSLPTTFFSGGSLDPDGDPSFDQNARQTPSVDGGEG